MASRNALDRLRTSLQALSRQEHFVQYRNRNSCSKAVAWNVTARPIGWGSFRRSLVPPMKARVASHYLSFRRSSDSATTRSVTDSATDASVHEAHVLRETKIVSRNQQRRILEEQRREQLERDLQQALDHYQECLETKEKTAPETLVAMLHELRTIYEALEYWEQALTLEHVLLQEHSSTMTSLEKADTIYRQGKLHMRLGDLSQASKLYQRALESLQTEWEATRDCDVSPLIGNLLISKAGIDFHKGRLQESLETLHKSEPYFRSDNGPHVDLVKCIQHQGLLHRSMQDFASARDKYEEGLEILEGLKDKLDAALFHEKRQSLQLDLADMLAALDDSELACDLYQTILEEDQKHSQSTEPTALEGIILHNLGRIHAQNEATRDLALLELTRAVELKQEFVGETHPEMLKSLNALGALHGVMKNPVMALQCFQQSLLIARMHADGEDDENIMLILRNIAILKGEKVAKWGDE